jgi:translocator protein
VDTIAPRSSSIANILALLGFLLLTLTVGFAGGQITAPNIASWYVHLAKPGFNPPNSVFMPVWTTLYVLMAVAAWRVWQRSGFHSRGLALWLIQLALNFAWSFIFFGSHALLPALLELVVLWFAVLATLLAFGRVDRPAGWLMIPYLAWVSFAGVLNFWIWRLNGAG